MVRSRRVREAILAELRERPGAVVRVAHPAGDVHYLKHDRETGIHSRRVTPVVVEQWRSVPHQRALDRLAYGEYAFVNAVTVPEVGDKRPRGQPL
jgi:hypothetical protein